MSLRSELTQFDGKVTSTLERILARHRTANAFVKTLVLLLNDEEPNIQGGATWLLKSLAESGVNFKTEYLAMIFGSLPELNHWLPRLHVCQMLQYLSIPSESCETVAWFLERNVNDENKFLRAWAYSGFYELAKQHREYFEFAIEQIELGEGDTAAAVRARIRIIKKTMNKTTR